MINVICGTATGCVFGQIPLTEYAMWLLWSGLSVRVPSQQFGKRTWTCRLGVAHAGGAVDASVGSVEQFQKTMCRLCGLSACELPATIFSPAGNGRTCASVLRR